MRLDYKKTYINKEDTEQQILLNLPQLYIQHTLQELQTVGTIDWEYEGLSATAEVVITGSVTAINVTNGEADILRNLSFLL